MFARSVYFTPLSLGDIFVATLCVWFCSPVAKSEALHTLPQNESAAVVTSVNVGGDSPLGLGVCTGVTAHTAPIPTESSGQEGHVAHPAYPGVSAQVLTSVTFT